MSERGSALQSHSTSRMGKRVAAKGLHHSLVMSESQTNDHLGDSVQSTKDFSVLGRPKISVW